MNRKEKVFRHIDKNGVGLEIGPSHNPLAPKKEGFNVHVIDHLNREGLICKYQNAGVQLSNIEEVDFVWTGETYSELTGNSKYYDWIIASHVIEHTPDFIGFLNDCDAILKDSGVLSLIVPDKRFCFDHYRPISGISRIIDNHLDQRKAHTAGTVAEYFLNVARMENELAWVPGRRGSYKFMHTVQDAQHFAKAVRNESAFVDVHGWCFVPHSFRLMIHDLYDLGLTAFREVEMTPTEDEFGFFITLSRSGKGSGLTRQQILEAVAQELAFDGLSQTSEPRKKRFFWS